MRFLFALVALAPLLVWLGAAPAAPPVAPPAPAPTAVAGDALAEDAVTSGEDLYYRRCSVCHGETGLGLEEARLAFPESHRRCTQCHKSGTSKILTFPFVDNNMFDVGQAPPIRGEGTLTAFGDPATLRAYIQAAMPRHAPDSLSEAEAEAIAAFVWGLKRQ